MKANKLQGLKITKVDLVDAGANQRAHIMLRKRKDEEEGEMEEQPDKAFLTQLAHFFTKMFHREDVEKGDARTYSDVEADRGIEEYVWRITSTVQDSMFSIIRDDDLTPEQKKAMIATSADEMREAIVSEIGGFYASEIEKTCGGGQEKTKKAEGADEPETDKAEPDAGEPQPEQKEGETDMKFDVTKMSPEEKAQFDVLKSKYGAEDADADAAAEVPAYDPEKDPVVKAMREQSEAMAADLKKMRDDLETEKLTIVAKQYEVLGQKPEDLVPILKQMKAAGEAAYNAYIKALDDHVSVVKQSGMFSEIGKRGGAGDADPWSKIEAAAGEIRKSDTSLTHEQSIEKACSSHPELVKEYESHR